MESTATVQELFKRWRNDGDADAGMEMAQKFSDWYYAITAARLGDRLGRPPLEAACQAFESGIVQVTRTSELVDWAWTLVERSTAAVGSRVNGGDFPNALTGNRSPTALIQTVSPRLNPVQLELLRATFDATVSPDDLSNLAEDNGGMPLAILQARYELKRLLSSQCQVPFQVLPASPNLDLAPLPLYESARMGSTDEEGAFEKWLLSDLELCKDVAEFSAFAHALRVGAMNGVSTALPPPVADRVDTPGQPTPPRDPAQEENATAPETASKGGGSRSVILLGLLFVIAFLVVLVLGLVFMR